MRKLIVVLGMHRSGTSVITRSLKVMGVELGENFLPPQSDNVTGFWEDTDINALNIEMLNVLHSDWHFLTPIQQADVEILRRNGYIQRALEMLQDKMSDAEVFGFKDPRVAKLLLFWREVFSQSNLKVSYVLVFRHPLSVWQSLKKRHDFGLEKSSLLWLEHIISSLAGTSNENCVLVDYDSLIQSPTAELERIAEELQLKIDPLELEKFEAGFLDKGLRHTVYQPEDLIDEKSILPLIREVYSALLDAVANKVQLSDVMIKSKITYWKNEYFRLTPVLSFIDKLDSQIRTMSIERDMQAQALTAQVAERDRQVQALTAQVTEQNIQMQALTTQMNDMTTSKAWRAAMLLRRLRHLDL
jgi:O-antigen biosynthesis protein